MESDPIGWANSSVANSTRNFQDQMVSLANTLYYLVLIPLAFVGNALSIAVVGYIARYQKTRRSIPDFCLGVLAGVDLFSVLFVHSLTLGAMAKGDWCYPPWVCVYQAFAASTYLKLEFLVQVTISVDRYFAVVRPLRYHRMSSVSTIRIIFAIIVVVSFGTTAVSIGFDTGAVTYMVTWKFCILGVRASATADYAIIACTGLIFVFGFIAFIFCNFCLVRILRHYHDKKADSLIREISQAVNTLAKEQKLSRSRHNSPTKITKFLEVPQTANSTVFKDHNAPVYAARQPSPSVSLNVGVVPEKSITSSKVNGDVGSHNKSNGTDSLNKSIENQLLSGSNTGKIQTNSLATEASVQSIPGIAQEKTNYAEKQITCASTDREVNGEMTNLETPAVLINNNECIGSREKGINPCDNVTNKYLASDSSADSESNLLWNSRLAAPDSPSLRKNYASNETFTDAFNGLAGTWTPRTRSTDLDPDEDFFFGINTYPPTRRRSHSGSSTSLDLGSRKCESIRTSFSFTESNKYTLLDGNKIHSASDRGLPYFTICPPAELGHSAAGQSTHTIDNGMKTMTAERTRATTPNIVSHSNIPAITVSSHGSQGDDQGSEGPRRPSRLTLKSSTSSIGFHPEHVAHFQENLQKFLKKVQKKAKMQKKELLLARLVIFCSTIFVVTWVPYVVVLILSLANIHVNQIIGDVVLKLVFANAMLNPIFYGLCRKNYRKGYRYIAQMIFHYLSCGVIDQPGDDKLFFESRRTKVKRHLEAAHVEPRQRRKSAHAFQLLQQTLVARSVTRSPAATSKISEFYPSSRLQDLFEKYINQSDSDSDSSDSIDYDALVFAQDDNMYENLKKMWSVCMYPDEQWSHQELDDDLDDDIELDVDYDALVSQDRQRGGSCGVIRLEEGGRRPAPNPMEPESHFLEIDRTQRMAMSTPDFSQALKQEAGHLQCTEKCEETRM